MTEKALSGLNCPNCSGLVPIPEGQVIVACPFCEMRSLVKGERGVRRHQVQQRIDRAKAQSAMREFLKSKMQIARNAARNSQVQESFIAFLPFWSKWSRVLGWVFGEEEIGSGKNSHYEPREVKIAEDMNWNGVALDVGEFGVTSIALESRAIEPFDADQLHAAGMVFEPVTSTSEADEQADQDFSSRVRRMGKLDRVSQVFTRYAKVRFGLVYYPLWVVRYLYRGRNFQVVIDGYNGEVLYGKAPGSTLFRTFALVAGMAVGAFIAVDGAAIMTYLAFASADDDGLGLLAFAAGAVGVGAGMMIWGYRAFRYGEQYEYHGHKKKKRGFRRKKEGNVRRAREKTI